MTPSAAVTVVIVNYNTKCSTLRAVESVHRANPSANVVVVDNGSTDGSVPALQALHPYADIITMGHNAGFAAAVNSAVERISSGYLLLLNSDASIESSTIDELVRFAQHNPRFGLYGGRIVDQHGTTDKRSCWGAMTTWSTVCWATGLAHRFSDSTLFNPEGIGAWNRDTVRQVGVISGCLLLTSVEIWRELGGMDTRYFLYGEDSDFCYRATKAGYKPVHIPTATYTHDWGGSSSTSARRACMVLAGRVTYFRQYAMARGRVAVGLTLMGVGVRAAREEMRSPRTRHWREVWKQRRAWVAGYPTAREWLFPDSVREEL